MNARCLLRTPRSPKRLGTGGYKFAKIEDMNKKALARPKRLRLAKSGAAYLSLLLTVAIWGIAAPVIKVTLEAVPPFTFLFLRFFLNTILITPFFLLYLKRHPLRMGELPHLTTLTLAGTTLTLSLIFLGIDRTSSLDASLLTATAPLFIILGGVLFLKEKMDYKEKIGLGLALLGVSLTVIQPLLEGGTVSSANLLGNLLLISSNLTWTFFTLFSRLDVREHSPFKITAFSFILGFLTFIPLAFLENPLFLSSIFHLPSSAWAGVIYMSVLSSITAYLLYEFSLEYLQAHQAALILYLQPVFTAPLAFLWLEEKITFPFIVGAALIASGVALTYKRERLSLGRRIISHLKLHR